ncbi:MAG: bifunctional hydroxymethylpyrimidine kinase/phosphomethylpyrimidine kinase [Armatimonadota bacterium]
MLKSSKPESCIKTAITIAGSDSCGGAGIQLDLKIFEKLGVYGLSTITAVTAQNTVGVQKINKVPPRIIAAQIDSVVKDIGVNACKIGMLYSSVVVTQVAERIRRHSIRNVVLDTVLSAKDGSPFLGRVGIKQLRRFLIPQALIVTPNVPEAEILSGIRIHNSDDMRCAAKKIHEMGCGYVLLKGGHLEGNPIDLLYDGCGFTEIPGIRVEGPPVHGTGCALSASIAARLALGDSVPDAVVFAKTFVRELIESAISLGKGNLLII